MRKLTLHIESLQVESFVAAETPAARGTVDAHGDKYSVTCETTQETCESQGCEPDTSDDVTCDATCLYSCYNSCAMTCEYFTCQFTCHPASPC